jgi:hypothetical protein
MDKITPEDVCRRIEWHADPARPGRPEAAPLPCLASRQTDRLQSLTHNRRRRAAQQPQTRLKGPTP